MPLLSGALFGFSFIPFPFFTLFVALVPLWLFMYRQTCWKKIVIACFLCQILSTFIGFNWMIYTFHSFGGINWFLSTIFFILYCSVSNVFMILSGALWFILSQKSRQNLSAPVKLILLPLIFALLHSLIPAVLPWNMGYPWLWAGLPGAHTAELWGFRFLGTLFYIFNLLFLIAYKHSPFLKIKKPFRGKKISLPYPDPIAKKALLGIFLLFAFLNGWGFYLKKNLPKPDQSLNVLLIQPNIGSIPLIDPRPFNSPKIKAFHILKNLTYNALKQTRKRLQREDIDLVIWPEGAYGWAIDKNSKTEKNLSKLAQTIKIPLITGAITKDYRQYSNSLVLLDRKGIILPIYDKTKLLVFGEYFPLINQFPFLRKLFPYFGTNLSPGKSPQVQEIESVRLGYQICYESLFDSISRELAQKKAQVLINITNDSWYGPWQEPYQHLVMNFGRAIEVRRPLIRATNTGYSGVILADGTVQTNQLALKAKSPTTQKVQKLLPINKALFGLYQVPYYKKPKKTLFMSWGFYCNEIFLLFLALLAGGIHFLKVKRKGTSSKQ